MKLTIDNHDGNGPIDYSSCVVAGRPFRILRRLNQPATCTVTLFTAPGVAQFGNVRRNQFTGPGELMSDMSIFKNFTITERVKAQFQAEFFNVFNHPVYALPGNTCIDCSGAGVITGLEFDSQMRQMQLGFRVTF